MREGRTPCNSNIIIVEDLVAITPSWMYNSNFGGTNIKIQCLVVNLLGIAMYFLAPRFACRLLRLFSINLHKEGNNIFEGVLVVFSKHCFAYKTPSICTNMKAEDRIYRIGYIT